MKKGSKRSNFMNVIIIYFFFLIRERITIKRINCDNDNEKVHKTPTLESKDLHMY